MDTNGVAVISPLFGEFLKSDDFTQMSKKIMQAGGSVGRSPIGKRFGEYAYKVTVRKKKVE